MRIALLPCERQTIKPRVRDSHMEFSYAVRPRFFSGATRGDSGLRFQPVIDSI